MTIPLAACVVITNEVLVVLVDGIVGQVHTDVILSDRQRKQEGLLCSPKGPPFPVTTLLPTPLTAAC